MQDLHVEWLRDGHLDRVDVAAVPLVRPARGMVGEDVRSGEREARLDKAKIVQT